MSQQEFEELIKGQDLHDDKTDELCLMIKERFPNTPDEQLMDWLKYSYKKITDEFKSFADSLSPDLSDQEFSARIHSNFPERNKDMLDRQIKWYSRDRAMKRMLEWAEKAQAEIDSTNIRRQVLPIVKAILDSKEELKPVIEMVADVFIERWLDRTK